MYKQILAVKQADALHRGFSEPVARVVEPGHVKRAQVEMDSPLHEELREFIRTLKPKTESTYVLVNAMGAGEFYGDNINGDFFPYAELVRTSSRWRGIPVTEIEGRRKESDSIGSGYTTFYRANAFKHHINKDPAKSYGTVECAVWNDRMKRVELVVRLDHKWCEERGGMDVLERALRNDFQDVSMGCRIPYDVCSICGNKAKTPAEYCVHIRERRTNKDPRGDGQRPYMINIKPRFFDISFVFIGADKTARTLMKIASQDHDRIYDYILDDVMRAHPRLPVQEVMKIAQALYDNGYSPCGEVPNEYIRYSPRRESSLWIPTIQPATEGEKTAGVFSLSVPKGIEKVGSINRVSARKRYEALKEAMYKRSALKMSDMIKYRLPNPDADEVSMLEKGQKLLPGKLLDEASDRYGLAGTLESAAREGIVLRRPEFTRVALRSSGLSSLVPVLSSLMHPPTEDIELPLPVSPCGCGLAGSLFTPFAPMRSIHPQHSITRIIVVKEASAVDDTRAGYGGRSGEQVVWLQPTPPEHLEMMSKISAAYNGYRCWLMANMEELEMGRRGEKQSAARLFSGTPTDRELEETVMPLFLEYTYW